MYHLPVQLYFVLKPFLIIYKLLWVYIGRWKSAVFTFSKIHRLKHGKMTVIKYRSVFHTCMFQLFSISVFVVASPKLMI